MPLIYPVLVQILLTFVMFGVMGSNRMAAVKSGRVKMGDIATSSSGWPEDVRKYGNNVTNQFETPVLFYVLVGIAIYIRATDLLMQALAWIYVLSRIVHAVVHVTNNAVLTRGKIFLVGLAALFVMWVLIVVRLLSAGPV